MSQALALAAAKLMILQFARATEIHRSAICDPATYEPIAEDDARPVMNRALELLVEKGHLSEQSAAQIGIVEISGCLYLTGRGKR